jgi:hypothetical protein
MRHVDDIQAFAAADGTAADSVKQHIDCCPRCRAAVEECQRLLADLDTLRTALTDPPQRLQRWARAWAGAVAHSRPRLSVLDILAIGAQPLAAVRDAGGHDTAMLYGDDRYQLDVRVTGRSDGTSRLHGQIVPLPASPQGRWKVTTVSSEGSVMTATSDANGEFWIEGVTRWEGLSLVADSETDRLIVPTFGGERKP